MHWPTNDAPETDGESQKIEITDAIGSSRTVESLRTDDDQRLKDRLAGLSPAQRELLRKRLAQRRGEAPPLVASDRLPSEAAADRKTQIAIVGMGCRFPGAASLDAFWELIQSGGEAVGPIPEDRWDKERFFDPTGRAKGKMSVDAMGAIDRVDQFDPAFFGISPREAARMDPQQRLLLEVTWETFENAGIPIDSLAGSDTGVFIGIGGTDYSKVPARYPDYFDHIDAHIGTGNALSIAAGRISYLFDFHGPSLIVDTACSSALVAIQNAVVALTTGQCDAAVAGGVNLILSPETTIAFSKARMLSPDGHCRPFDDAANGYVRGEGCGIVLLKRAADALAAGDQVLGIIRGAAVNQDGRTSGITAPSGPAQVRVIESALQSASATTDDITYVEAHGTGTPLGDPIELMALDQVFRNRSADLPPVRIGSVKANIGHTETASGIAGLLKVLLMFRHGKIPAQANFDRINTNARISGAGICVSDAAADWRPIDGRPRMAGISSFGFGGTNAHLVVESPFVAVEPSSNRPPETGDDRVFAMPLSAQSDAALADLSERMLETIDRLPADSLGAVCQAAATRRSGLNVRGVAVADSADGLAAAWHAFAGGQASSDLVTGTKAVGRRPRVAMLFTGQGSQYAPMASRLRQTVPAFAQSLDACGDVLDDRLPRSLASILEGSGATSGSSIDHTSLAQPAICAVQCALVDAYRSVGIKPDIVAGHSIGEIAALYAAGAIRRDDALRIAAYRGEAMGALPEGGSMAAILADQDQVADLISSTSSAAVIATMNGPGNTVIAGEVAQVERVLEAAQSAQLAFKRLAVSHAFHSPLMEPAAEKLAAKLTSLVIPARVPTGVTFLSSVTGDRYQDPIDVEYWIRHLTSPVRFTDVIEQLSNQKSDVAIELGPSPHLTSMIRRSNRTRQAHDKTKPSINVVPAMEPGTPDDVAWLRSVAAAWVIGSPVDWKAVSPSSTNQRVELPTYPFQRKRYWYEPAGAGSHAATGDIVHPLLGTRQDVAGGQTLFSCLLRESDPGFLADHVVSGSITVPAAAWIETLRAAAQIAMDQEPTAIELRNIEIKRAQFLETGQSLQVQTLVRGGSTQCKIEINARVSGQDDPWQTCAIASARVRKPGPAMAPRSLLVPESHSSIGTDAFYAELASSKLQYGPYFQVLDAVTADGQNAQGRLGLSPEIQSAAKAYGLHPTTLDGGFQLIAAMFHRDANDRSTFLPVGAASITMHNTATPSHAQVQRIVGETVGDGNHILADVELLDDVGQCVARVHRLKLQRLGRSQSSQDGDPSGWLHSVRWSPSETEQASAPEQPDREERIWCLDEDGFGRPQRSGLECAGICADLVEFFQAAIAADPAPRVTVITRHAVAVRSGETVDPIASAVAALTSVATNEHPQLGIRLIDFDLESGPKESVIESVRARGETVIAVRRGQVFHPRLVCGPPESDASPQDPKPEVRLPRHGSYRLRLDGTNTIEGLWVQRIVPPPAKRGEVTVAIDAVGLNFSDVLKTIGLYPGIRDAIVPLGIEVCGRVSEVGSGVKRFAVGDRVMGIVPHGFASHDATHDYLLTRVPESISDQEAASLPVAFLTAHHALLHVGRLRAGESALIHAGAGGVGLAAIQIARSIGATVFTTVGSQVKRELLCELGVPADHIFDSRDATSIEAITRRTGGRGVDMVLNSLPGLWIDQSLAVLAPHGRFLEIGKTDIYQDRPLGLSPFRNNLSYSAIDLDQIFRDRPDQVRTLFDEVTERFESGLYRPLPITTFRADELPEAMRFMAARRNIGKIVVSSSPTLPDEAARAGVHLITGGSGSIAIGLARRLIERGAQTVALVARREKPTSVVRLEQLAHSRGARCLYVPCDCADPVAMRSAITSLVEMAGPITSIVHAAGVLDDALIHETTADSLVRVMRPKVDGAMVLDQVTADQPVARFQLLGSIASPFGSPGQAAYAAANGFLEGFVADRRRRGLPASLVHWGPWSGDPLNPSAASTGMAGEATRMRNLQSRGLRPLSFEQAVDMLIDAPEREFATTPIVVDADFPKMLSLQQASSVPSLLRSMRSSTSPGGAAATSARDDALLGELAALPLPQRNERLCGYLADQLGKIISMDARSIDPGQPLGALGLDSLMAIELKNTIEAKLDLTLPISKFMNEPTIRSLAEAAGAAMAATANTDSKKT